MYTNVPTSATGSFNYLTEQHVIELIFKGRLSGVCRNFDRDYLYKVMHTFPDLNSILPVVVVVCHRGFVY